MLYDKERLEKLMDNYDLDAIVCTSPENVKYFSGFSALEPYNTFFSFIKVRGVDPILLVPIAEMGGILSSECWVSERRFYGRYYIENVNYKAQSEEPINGLISILKEFKVDKGKVGIEGNNISYKR